MPDNVSHADFLQPIVLGIKAFHQLLYRILGTQGKKKAGEKEEPAHIRRLDEGDGRFLPDLFRASRRLTLLGESRARFYFRDLLIVTHIV